MPSSPESAVQVWAASRHGPHLVASLCEGGAASPPEVAVLRAPRTERRRGVVARFGVGGVLRVQRNGQPQREEAAEAPERARVDPLGKESLIGPGRFEGSQPGRLGVSDFCSSVIVR